MPLGIQHYIFRFEISLNDMLVVHLFNTTENLRYKKPQCLCVKHFEFLQVLKEFTIFLVFSHNKELGIVLE